MRSFTEHWRQYWQEEAEGGRCTANHQEGTEAMMLGPVSTASHCAELPESQHVAAILTIHTPCQGCRSIAY